MPKIKDFMNLDSKKFTYFVVVLFIFLHILLINVNAAEWGDSYRILRASEYIRDFSYPIDEKRPPLFSIVLAARPEGVEQVLWARVEMFVISTISFYVFYKLIDLLVPNNIKVKNLALLFFTLNPVYLYWSLRIMADVPFTVLVLLVFYFLTKYRNAFNFKALIIMGVIVGLAVLTRFEGYILFGVISLGIVFSSGFEKISAKIFFDNFKHSVSQFSIYLISFIVTIFPYMYFRNPLKSSYFAEPSGRTYDLNTLFVYLVSLMFAFGIVTASYFFVKNRNNLKKFLFNHVGISSFLVIELFLALIWPAAIPRLFTPGIPFLIILLALSVDNHFLSKDPNPSRKMTLITNFALLGVYVVGQYLLRLQFLVLLKPIFILIILLSVVQIIAVYKKDLFEFVSASMIIMFIWSVSVIWMHRDIYLTVKEVSALVADRFEGRVAYNDANSVSEWYLNYYVFPDNIDDFYYWIGSDAELNYSELVQRNVDYVLLTNEANPNLDLDLSDESYLEELVDFRHNANGAEFYTKLYKFDVKGSR